jgi:SAM-dependent methyltransferase
VQDYLEDVWQRLPADAEGPDLELRRRFLHSVVQAGDRALDLGCGDGVLTAELQRAGADVTGVEVARAALVRAQARHPELRFELAEIDRPLPFADATFTLVWASEVIEHVADTARWLSEVRRVLAPGGRLALTTPSHGRLRVALGGVERFSEPLGDHLHLYTRSSLRALLSDFDFAQTDVRTAGGPPLLRRLLLARAVR